MASIYQPLIASLARQPGLTCALTFHEIKACLGRPHPPKPAFAGTGGDTATCTHAYHGWLAAGWRIASVDLARQVVTFVKS
jgi:hypothetical protein